MDQSKKSVPTDAAADTTTNTALKRIDLTKVMIMAPALLSLIKHCQDKKESTSTINGQTRNGVMGNILGYIEEQPEIDEINLKITQAHVQIGPESKNKQDSQFYVGFYVSCQQGLAFSAQNLNNLINAFKNFPNSVMIIYDITKSQYGLNPFQCFRLSKGAITALKLDTEQPVKDKLIIDVIRENSLNVHNFFEEVPLKIHRSHLIQAFLFDHVAPEMPAFNTNLLKLGTTSQHLTQYHHLASEHSQNLIDELAKVENQHKNQIKLAKKASKKIQQQIL